MCFIIFCYALGVAQLYSDIEIFHAGIVMYNFTDNVTFYVVYCYVLIFVVVVVVVLVMQSRKLRNIGNQSHCHLLLGNNRL